MTIPPDSADRNDTGRIRWDLLLGGNFYGHVGTRTEPAFSLFLATPGTPTPWALRSDLLTGYTTGTHPDDLKAEAERWLAEFISSLGASFGDALAADLRSRASEVRAMPADCTTERRDRKLFAAGLDRAADLAEHGDRPAVGPGPDEPPKETGQ